MVDRGSSSIWRNKKRIHKGEKRAILGVGRNIFKGWQALAHGEESQLRAKKISTGNGCSVNLD
jgi:hypothetical protein